MATAQLALGVLLLAVGAVATRIDLRRREIPNWLTGCGALAAVVIGSALDPGGEPARVVAGVLAAGFLLGAALANPGGMGMGDVKLAGVMGLSLGSDVAVALLAAFAAGATYGLAILLTRGRSAYRTATMAFGPCLALGSVAGVLVS